MTDFNVLQNFLERPESVAAEWERLTRDRYSQAEFAVQLHHIARLIPAGAAVADIGSGPGRYALELLRRGCRVALADLSGAFLEKARQEIDRAGLAAGVICFERLNAVKLSAFSDGQFDHALLMGPLINMDSEDERGSALLEAARVVKPGGLVFVTVLGCLRRVAEMFYVPDLKFRRTALDSYGPRLPELLTADLNRPERVRALIAACGLKIELEYGADSAAGLAFDRIDEMAATEEGWKKVVDALVKLSTDPACAALASHTTYVLRKPAA